MRKEETKSAKEVKLVSGMYRIGGGVGRWR